MKTFKGWQVIQIFGILFALGLLAGFLGCAIAPSRTKIVWFDGKEIKIDAQDGSAVTVKLDDDMVTVDNRKPSMLRDFINLWMLKEIQQPVVNK